LQNSTWSSFTAKVQYGNNNCFTTSPLLRKCRL
jgi:hypothetical protein